VADPVQAVAVEGVQVGPDAVGVEGQEGGAGGGVPALGVEDEGLGAALLGAVAGVLEELPQLAAFGGRGTARAHGAGHSWASSGERGTSYSTKG
jgi:hypothetical protein